ncbi:MAG TPA: YdbH domain-containing protein [Caulobacteraceae bacterium]|nr:YdbH domain-containing protein [Caulobacteraceae bacterium]
MTDASAETGQSFARPPREPRRRGAARASLAVLAVAAFGLAATAVVVYVARREIAEQAVVGWLEKRGVESEIAFDSVGLDGFTGTLRAGPQNDPALTVQRIEVDMALAWPWQEGGFRARPTRVRLVKPVLKAAWRNGELDFGALDPVIDEFMKKPPRPDERGPRVLVEDGLVRLSTPHGLVPIRGGASIDDGQLLTLDARVPSARLAGTGFSGQIEGALLRARKRGDRLAFTAEGGVAEWISAGLELEAARFDLEGDLPYPDFKTKRGEGRVSLTGALRAEGAGAGEAEARGTELNLRFDGRSQGWLNNLRLTGEGRLIGRAEGFSSGALDARDLRIEARAADLELASNAEGLTWRANGEGALRAARARQGGTYLEGAALTFASARVGGRSGHGIESAFQARADVDRLAQGDLTLRGVRGDFRGDARLSGAALIQLTGGVTAARGSWTALGAPSGEDVPEIAALKRALGDFRLSAPALTLESGSPGTAFSLDAPLRLTPATGGSIVLTPRRGAPLFASSQGAGRGGGFDLAMSGGALPKADVSVAAWRLIPEGAGSAFVADASGKLALDAGVLRGGTLDAAGTLRIGGGGVTFAGSRCAVITAERLELGDSDVTGLNGALCPDGAPLLTLADGWTVRGRAEGFDAAAPFLDMHFADLGGPVTASGGRGPLRLETRIASGQVVDAAAEPRFRPLGLSGTAALTGDDWKGAFGLTREGVRVARLDLTHDGRRGAGGLDIRAEDLTFAPGALQPADLSPIAASIGTDVAGAVDFTGGFRWNPAGGTSGGTLSIDGLNFTSFAGAVTQLKGEIALTSLAPLISAPNQTLTVESVAALVPLQSASVSLQLDGETLRIKGGQFAAAEGRVTVEPFAIPLKAGQSWEGAIRLTEVNVDKIVDATGWKEDVEIRAVVSGRIPFAVTPEGLRFMGGELHAVRPGRVSIQRAAVTKVEAEGGGEAAETSPIQDFAYQAMENLAFDTLDAEVNSLPQGRLGVLFKIKGRHDPPQKQEIKLTWLEVLQRRFMDRKLPLPSGTEVDLTLDTTFNFDEIVRAVRDIRRAQTAGKQ